MVRLEHFRYVGHLGLKVQIAGSDYRDQVGKWWLGLIVAIVLVWSYSPILPSTVNMPLVWAKYPYAVKVGSWNLSNDWHSTWLVSCLLGVVAHLIMHFRPHSGTASLFNSRQTVMFWSVSDEPRLLECSNSSIQRKVAKDERPNFPPFHYPTLERQDD